ncbi:MULTISPECIES: BMP family ABC transporter substrate-binding protein [Calditerrivibrio]|jgi:basic membrane protein A|uniref:BMP family ABC transporter substrate-binding protein n=1 Tax=Calditerrivibrio nitroreducens TaxID=477976 RepID=A0A2J6WNT5_9BACT|nr:MAG: BMP family ABC transporter substrate-binding protein [Calditerrivibrio nitroreducens]
MLKKILFLMVFLFTFNLLYAKDLNVGFVYVGPVGDGGWTYAHDLGRQEMAKLPFVKKTQYIESVPEGADATRVITNLAQKGYNLIFTTSFGYMDPTIEVAKKFKNVVFMHCSGYKTADNVGNYFGRMYQARYLSGIIAGSMTKSNIIGYVAAHPIPEVIRGINAFTLGVRSVNPKAVVKVVWTNTWFDPATERNAADSLLDVGADLLTMHQDTPATLQAAEKRGKFVIGYNSDMRKYAPNGFLTAPVWNWGVLYKEIATQVSNGTWKPSSIWWGLDKGIIDLAPLSPKIPSEIVKKVELEKRDIISGKNKIFVGPLKDNSGKIVVPARKVMSDQELLSMNFFVEGVQGTIKK